MRKATSLGRAATTQQYALEAAEEARATTVSQFRSAMAEVQSLIAPAIEEKDAALALAEEEGARASAAEASAEQASAVLAQAEHKLQAMGLTIRASHEQLRLLELEQKVVPMQELEAVRAELGRLSATYTQATANAKAEAEARGAARVEEVQASAEAAVASLRRALGDAHTTAVASSTSFFEGEILALQTRLDRETAEHATERKTAVAGRESLEARLAKAEEELEEERAARRQAEARAAQVEATSGAAQTVGEARCQELEMRLEVEGRARAAAEASLAAAVEAKQQAEERVLTATLGIERETLARVEAETRLAELRARATQVMEQQQQLEEALVTSTLRWEAEVEVSTVACRRSSSLGCVLTPTALRFRCGRCWSATSSSCCRRRRARRQPSARWRRSSQSTTTTSPLSSPSAPGRSAASPWRLSGWRRMRRRAGSSGHSTAGRAGPPRITCVQPRSCHAPNPRRSCGVHVAFVRTHSGHRGRSMSCRPRPTKHWYGRLLKLAKTLLAK